LFGNYSSLFSGSLTPSPLGALAPAAIIVSPPTALKKPDSSIKTAAVLVIGAKSTLPNTRTTTKRIATIPPFSGNRHTDKITPANWIKDCRIYFREREIDDDNKKLEEVGDRFRIGSPADAWFKDAGVQRKVTGDWKVFETTFLARFEGVRAMSKPVVQLIAELGGMRIDMDALSKEYVLVGDEHVTPMVDFTARVKDAVSAAGAGKDRDGVYAFHHALPSALRIAAGDVPNDWEGMLKALNNIPQIAIETAVEDYKKLRTMEMNMDQLAKRLNSVRVTPLAPVGPPVGNAPVAPVAGGVPPAQGTLRGPRRAIKAGTEAEKAALRTIMERTVARRAPNTAEGRTTYAAQVAEWTARNGHIPSERIAVETTGYPLSPGTAPPCSGECWKCGICTTPLHRDVCPTPQLPDLGKRFRAVCRTWFGRMNAPIQMNLVEEMGVPWYGDEGGVQDEEGF
jgi:hypothetical protein